MSMESAKAALAASICAALARAAAFITALVISGWALWIMAGGGQ